MTDPKICGTCHGVREHREVIDQGHVAYLCDNDAFHDATERCATEGDDTPTSEPPPNHEDFVAARKAGFKGLRKYLNSRQRKPTDD